MKSTRCHVPSCSSPFRTGTDSLIADAQGNSRISAEDYAIAFVDELEQGRFVRQIATVAY